LKWIRFEGLLVSFLSIWGTINYVMIRAPWRVCNFLGKWLAKFNGKGQRVVSGWGGSQLRSLRVIWNDTTPPIIWLFPCKCFVCLKKDNLATFFRLSLFLLCSSFQCQNHYHIIFFYFLMQTLHHSLIIYYCSLFQLSIDNC